VLYLSKPLGTGVLTTAFKRGRLDEAGMAQAFASMCELNARACEAMLAAGVHAATDVSGFGLLGHLHEMLAASGCSALLEWERIPLLEGVWDLYCAGCRPGRTSIIREFYQDSVEPGNLSSAQLDNRLGILCDPQTSGGLLMAIPPEQAEAFEAHYAQLAGRPVARIGIVVEGTAGHVGFAE